ncbi:MAG: tRNA pseudouridine(38-40) synthase TruA [Candidatus Enteromonas sp.]|nr:tRNA pseudouridine(38-40) synthase TruA [Candidatus Enteromonas sp.]
MKYAGIVSYCGAYYHGFERQVNLITVQGCIENHLSFICGEPISIKAAGRTDAGVSATGQVISFTPSNPIDNLPAFTDALNRLLPRDIEFLKIVPVKDEFDPRHSCYGKRYEYRFSYGSKCPLSAHVLAYFGNRKDFDAVAFKEAIHLFEGKHWFANFTTKETDKDDFFRIVHVECCEIDEEKRMGVVRFSGNGFMTYMVRFMIGAALKAALHKFEPDFIQKRLLPGERAIVPYKASPEGLSLIEVLYHEKL